MWCCIVLHTPPSPHRHACPQRYARCCTFCAPTAACTYVCMCVCWLSDSHALPVSRHYTAHPLPANALAFAHPQSSREVYFNTCALRHHLHLQTTRSREMMRSSPDASGGQPLTEAVPAPLISHMQFVDHVVLLHVGISGYLHLWQTVASA